MHNKGWPYIIRDTGKFSSKYNAQGCAVHYYLKWYFNDKLPCSIWIAYKKNSDHMMRHHHCKILPSSFPCEKGSNAIDVEPALAHVENFQRKPGANNQNQVSEETIWAVWKESRNHSMTPDAPEQFKSAKFKRSTSNRHKGCDSCAKRSLSSQKRWTKNNLCIRILSNTVQYLSSNEHYWWTLNFLGWSN